MASSTKIAKLDRVMDIIVSGAAVPVLLGALFKITHAPGAEIWLKVGLYTEAFIFALYAVRYMIYPVDGNGHGAAAVAAPAVTTTKLDLSGLGLSPEEISNLRDGFKKLGSTVEHLGDLGNVAASTNDYVAKTKEATVALDTVKTAYTNAAGSLVAFNGAADGTKDFNTQITQLSQNLSQLNKIYESELQQGSQHVGAMNEFYTKLNDMSQNLLQSATDAKKTQEELASLSANLGKLNQVYGNVISAMSGR